MLTTPSPLTEKMVLFWHNHFVSSLQKVRSPVLMYRQNALLRKHALGYFGDLLHEVAKDPAMVIYLDSASNRKGQPNENFAREVMELFTLGEGNYGENDIKEAARAFTGWSLDPDTGEFVVRPLIHDDGVKTVLGRSGNFDGDAVLDILLAQPQTAEFIVAKLWREFVSPTPDPAEVKRIARMFRDNRYNIKVALRALLDGGRLLRAGEPRGADQIAGRPDRRHAAPVPLRDRRVTAVRAGVAPARPGPVCAAQRQGLAGRRGVDQQRHAAAAQAAARTAVPRAGNAASGGYEPHGGDPVRTIGKAGTAERLVRAMLDIRFDGDKWLSQFRPANRPW